MLLSVTIALVEVAVNLYQTSSSGVPLAQPVGIPLLADAAQTVPELLVVPTVNVVAPEHSSFAGGKTGATYNTQTLNVHLLVGVEVGGSLVKTRK